MNKEIEIKHGKALADEYIKGKPFVEYHAMLKKAFIDGFTSNRIYINGGVVVESPAPVDDVVETGVNTHRYIPMKEGREEDSMKFYRDRHRLMNKEVDALKEELNLVSQSGIDKITKLEEENAQLKKRVEELERNLSYLRGAQND